MGRANKNIISHTNSRYYRAIDGNEKIRKGTPNVRCGSRCGVGNAYCQCKNCGRKFSVPQIHIGKKGKCPKCKRNVIPAQARIHRAIIFINLLVGFLYFLRVRPALQPQPAE